VITLAIDTSFGTSVALLQESSVLAEVNHTENMTHAERIGESIEQVLASAKLVSSQVDRVVVGLGPGPFTGLRVGIAAAKFFAIGVNAELVGVCSLDGIAFNYFKSGGQGRLLVSTDARRKELFWATYEKDDELFPERTSGPSVSKIADVDTAGYQTTDLPVTASALGQLAFSLGRAVIRDVSAIYLREPDATPGKSKRVSG
jgi:tRNA threonylcarbamoyl adenosine modification protein YeaZ